MKRWLRRFQPAIRSRCHRIRPLPTSPRSRPGITGLTAGTAEIVGSGDIAAAVKAKFPWARGALVIHVEEVAAQL